MPFRLKEPSNFTELNFITAFFSGWFRNCAKWLSGCPFLPLGVPRGVDVIIEERAS